MVLRARRMTGLTLVELVVAMAVLVVTITIGLPSFSSLLERIRTAGAYHQISSSLVLARMTAITRHQPAVMCPSSDGQRCRSDLAWEDGWIVFTDHGRSGQPEDPADVLRYVNGIGGDLLIRSSRGRPLVRYLPNGRAYGSNVSLRVCRGPRQLAKIVVNNVGRVRSELAAADIPC